VTDQAGLQQTSCECYRVVRAEQDRIMGGTFDMAQQERG
jgi:hypothetical protein